MDRSQRNSLRPSTPSFTFTYDFKESFKARAVIETSRNIERATTPQPPGEKISSFYCNSGSRSARASITRASSLRPMKRSRSESMTSHDPFDAYNDRDDAIESISLRTGYRPPPRMLPCINESRTSPAPVDGWNCWRTRGKSVKDHRGREDS